MSGIVDPIFGNKDQKALIEDQKKSMAASEAKQAQLEEEKKKKEAEAIRQSFLKARPQKSVSGADLPGAVKAGTIGAPAQPTQAANTLIGS